jgi:catechol 2,3-dioxygenase-like lactoylglutathione lyase family enzyme
MSINSKSIIPFIGSKDFKVSKAFYTALGFKESNIDSKMSLFTFGKERAFYLQDAFVKDWIENTMLFWEVENLNSVHSFIKSLDLELSFAGVRVSDIRIDNWGNEFFVHDPAGNLWHIGEFS